MSDYLVKIAVVGSGGVGKSCLTIRFLRGMFVEKYDPTIEESYVQNVKLDDKHMVLEILDTAGQEEYVAIRDRYLKTQDGFVCVISLTDKGSVGQVRDTFTRIKRIKRNLPIVGILLGNKCDVDEELREISADYGNKIGASVGIPYLECSAKTGHNVKMGFMACVEQVLEFRKKNPKINYRNKKEYGKKKKKKGGCILL